MKYLVSGKTSSRISLLHVIWKGSNPNNSDNPGNSENSVMVYTVESTIQYCLQISDILGLSLSAWASSSPCREAQAYIAAAEYPKQAIFTLTE